MKGRIGRRGGFAEWVRRHLCLNVGQLRYECNSPSVACLGMASSEASPSARCCPESAGSPERCIAREEARRPASRADGHNRGTLSFLRLCQLLLICEGGLAWCWRSSSRSCWLAHPPPLAAAGRGKEWAPVAWLEGAVARQRWARACRGLEGTRARRRRGTGW